MNFNLNEDQNLFANSVERWLDKEYDFARRQKLLSDDGASAAIWRVIAEMGWLGAGLPESVGGFGGGPVEVMILAERLGKALFVEPFVMTAVVGAKLLQAIPADRGSDLIERLVAGGLQIALAGPEAEAGYSLEQTNVSAVAVSDGWIINGEKRLVPNGAAADVVFITARHGGELGLFAVPGGSDGITVRRYRLHNGQAAAALSFRDVLVPRNAVIASGALAIDILDEAIDYGNAALCAEAMGSSQYLVAATAGYLRNRNQYGASLAKFQVLQHRLADMYVASEMTRSMAFLATVSLEQPSVVRKRDVSAACVQCIQGWKFVAEQAVQLHGGMGVSEELDIAHHLKRAMVAGLWFGDEAYHLDRFSTLSEPQLTLRS